MVREKEKREKKEQIEWNQRDSKWHFWGVKKAIWVLGKQRKHLPKTREKVTLRLFCSEKA